MKSSYESSEKSSNISRELFGCDNIYKSSSYKVIDNVLVRISNHMPKSSNLEAYNDVENLDGVLFVFIKDNDFDFESEIEKEFGDDFNYYVVEIDVEDEFSSDDLQYYINKVK